ncbi:hypothetical protein [Paracoccus rhizosphaerae]
MTMLAGCAICALATAAQADCAEDLARLTGEPATAGDSAGISKDGSLAPLETPDTAEATAATDMEADSNDDADMAASGSSSDMTTPASDPGDMADDAGAEADDGATMASDADTEAGDGAAMASDEDAASGEAIAKDGSLAPLETEGGDASTDVAMSAQDAAQQQEGNPTAAQEAEAGDADAETDMASGSSPDRDALIEEARSALAAGDEDACRAALDQVESL